MAKTGGCVEVARSPRIVSTGILLPEQRVECTLASNSELIPMRIPSKGQFHAHFLRDIETSWSMA